MILVQRGTGRTMEVQAHERKKIEILLQSGWYEQKDKADLPVKPQPAPVVTPSFSLNEPLVRPVVQVVEEPVAPIPSILSGGSLTDNMETVFGATAPVEPTEEQAQEAETVETPVELPEAGSEVKKAKGRGKAKKDPHAWIGNLAEV